MYLGRESVWRGVTTKHSVDIVNDQDKYRKVLRNWETPFNRTPEEVWPEMEERMNQVKVVKMNRKPSVWKWTAAAASVVMALGLFFYSGSEELNVLISSDQNRLENVTLPDLSEVSLNVQSKLSYSGDWDQTRSVYLDGQAFFNVTKGVPFSVETEQGKVEVLGTSFDVFAREEGFEVACFTGKVRVSFSGKTIALNPGERAKWASSEFLVQEFQSQIPGWTEGEFSFENEPLSRVFSEIGRQFKVKVNYSGLESRRYTGGFTSENLDEALESVCLPMKLTFTLETNGEVKIAEAEQSGR